MSWQTENRAPEASFAGKTEAYDTLRKEPIREAGPIGKAKETIGYLNDLDALLGEVRTKLYGPSPQEAQVAGSPNKEPSLEEMMHHICQRTAGISGDVRNLLSRLD